MTDQLPFPYGTQTPAPPLEQSNETVPLDAPLAAIPAEPLSSEEQREAIEQASADAAALAQSVAKVELNFPVIGFIDPVVELEKMRQIAAGMLEQDKRDYPEKVRAKLIAWHANQKDNPPVTDEELALAIYLRRTTDTPLTAEDIEAKTTGKVKKDPAAPKAPKAPSKKQQKNDDLLKDLGL